MIMNRSVEEAKVWISKYFNDSSKTSFLEFYLKYNLPNEYYLMAAVYYKNMMVSDK